MAEVIVSTENPSTLALRDEVPAVEAVVIASPEHYVQVGERIVNLKLLEKRIAETFKPLKQKAHEAHKAVCDAENELLKPVREQIAALDTAKNTWEDAQERLRAEETAALTLLALADEEDRREVEAAALEAAGQLQRNPVLLEQAREIRQTPMRAPVVSVEQTVPKLAGLRRSISYVVRCENQRALVLAVARPHVYRELAALFRSAEQLQKYPAALGEALRGFAADLERATLAMPFVPMEALTHDESWVRNQAEQCKGKLDYPGIVIEQLRKSARTR